MLSTVNDIMIGKPCVGPEKSGAIKKYPLTMNVGDILLVNPGNLPYCRAIVASGKMDYTDTFDEDLNVMPVSGMNFRFVQKIGTAGKGLYAKKVDGSFVKVADGRFRFSDLLSLRSIAYASENAGIISSKKGVYYKEINSDLETTGKTLAAVQESGLPYVGVLQLVPGTTITADAVYRLEIIYKGVRDLSPNSFSKPYVYKATGTPTAEDILKFFVKAINDDKFSKVTAEYQKADKTGGSETSECIVLTAIDPQYSLNQRYEFDIIRFEASMVVETPGNVVAGTKYARWDDGPGTAGTGTVWSKLKVAGATKWRNQASLGIGDWRVVSDIEKRQLAHQGITNWVHFPVQLPEMFTRRGCQYNSFTFDYAQPYNAADNTIGRKARQNFQLFLDLGDNNKGSERIKNVGLLQMADALGMLIYSTHVDFATYPHPFKGLHEVGEPLQEEEPKKTKK